MMSGTLASYCGRNNQDLLLTGGGGYFGEGERGGGIQV